MGTRSQHDDDPAAILFRTFTRKCSRMGFLCGAQPRLGAQVRNTPSAADVGSYRDAPIC